MYRKIMETSKYTSDMVGLIKYGSYWRSYSLIVNVDEETGEVTVLDSFADHVGTSRTHILRTHHNTLGPNDALMSVDEFYRRISR